MTETAQQMFNFIMFFGILGILILTLAALVEKSVKLDKLIQKYEEEKRNENQTIIAREFQRNQRTNVRAKRECS